MKPTHFDRRGRVRMVDVSTKKVTERLAIARGEVRMSQEAFRALKENRVEKGEAIALAKTAGILAAKKTAELIPLCHSLPVDSIHLDFHFSNDGQTVKMESRVRTQAKTGVEMEALTAVAVSCLTLYDMCKALDKRMVIQNIRLIKKTGGKSGTYIWDGKKNENRHRHNK